MNDAHLDPAASARHDLEAWRAEYPEDLYGADRHLQAVLRRHLDATRLGEVAAVAGPYGREVVAMGPKIEAYRDRPPIHEPRDGLGRHVERIRFDAGYHEVGRRVWASGLVAAAASPGDSFRQAVLAYLTSTEGEMGHMCAATCSTGMIRVLRRHGTDAVHREAVARLADPDYDRGWRGAQFLTEVQGGSDVGANAVRAVAAGDGTFRISGEKWFCSVAEADAFLLLARPEGAGPGTRGLGCFLVPRHHDGAVNGFRIVRLKDKLGTTSMASAEIEFDNAVAYPVGPLDAGFKIMVTGMLNSSRWLNALGDLGILRRCVLETEAYARHRKAFGRPIAAFPMLRARLAQIKAEWLAALHSTLHLTALDEYVDTNSAALDPMLAAEYRFLVNANKLVVSLAATDAARTAIEVLGGNGAIETFSVLPRLLRDAIVYEQWEGTHNVLADQVRRDLGRLDLVGAFADRVERSLKMVDDAEVVARVTEARDAAVAGLGRCAEDEDYGLAHVRAWVEYAMRVVQVGLLLDAVADPAPGTDADLLREVDAAARWLLRHRLGADAMPRPGDAGLVDHLVPPPG